MISKETIAYMKLAHGIYNFVMMLLFMYQGSLGLQIRSLRKKDSIIPPIVSRHRKQGPALTLLSIIGFLSGTAVIAIDTGKILKYPLHLAVGFVVVVLIITTFFISKKIKGRNSGWRTPHFVTGIAILFLYVVQVLIGIGLLF
jgi:Protein of unknown function (DUF4079)